MLADRSIDPSIEYDDRSKGSQAFACDGSSRVSACIMHMLTADYKENLVAIFHFLYKNLISATMRDRDI